MQRGVQVVAIGQGTGSQAGQFCEKWGVDFECLGDPDRESYRAYEIARGGWWGVLFKSLLSHPIRSIRLLLDGDRAGLRLEATDVLQLPGLAIVEAGGVVRARHVAHTSEDMPAPEEVFAMLDELRLDLVAGRTKRSRIESGEPDAFAKVSLGASAPV